MAKTIENKATTMLLTEDTPLTYAHLLATIVNKPVKEGVTIKDMKRDLDLLDKLEDAVDKEVIEVTDEELKHLAKETEAFVWGTRHRDLVAFVEYIDSLK